MAGRFRCNERTLDAYHNKLRRLSAGSKVPRIGEDEDWTCRGLYWPARGPFLRVRNAA
jgi:hypothetical protein